MRSLGALLCLVVWSDAWPLTLVPVVYRDDYVTVSAGIVEASERMARVGNVLTLRVAVQFSADNTRISDLDDAFFERMFTNQPEVRLLESPGVQQIAQAGGMAVVQKDWLFQVLNCPDVATNCPGTRHYSLPITILDYAILRGDDQRPSQRSARFRPWPEKLSLVSVFPGQFPDDSVIEDWIPANAMPLPAPIPKTSSLAPLPLAVGTLLLLFGFFYRDAANQASNGDARVRLSTRWQQVAATLADAGLSDAEWLDRYRRCLVWYLIDEEGVNPFAASSDVHESPATLLLADILGLVTVDDRARLLGRLHECVGLSRTEVSDR